MKKTTVSWMRMRVLLDSVPLSNTDTLPTGTPIVRQLQIRVDYVCLQQQLYCVWDRVKTQLGRHCVAKCTHHIV